MPEGENISYLISWEQKSDTERIMDSVVKSSKLSKKFPGISIKNNQ